MSEREDDPLLGLLTDIAEGVATLAARVGSMEAKNAVHQKQENAALATIAEIATRTYYASKPDEPLPDDVINASVMSPMIERWPSPSRITFPPSEFEIVNDLEAISTEEIEALLREWAVVGKKTTNAERLRHSRALAMLKQEMTKRFKAYEKSMKRENEGRSR
jgi:hypothetical protein